MRNYPTLQEVYLSATIIINPQISDDRELPPLLTGQKPVISKSHLHYD